jgi:hypothetical protein
MAGNGAILRNGSTSGSKAFMRTWGNPELTNIARDLSMRHYRYLRLWDLYDGTAFQNRSDWSEYAKTMGLYRNVRQIWDHVHELVEFYATHVWSGSLAGDGLTLPEGVPNAIPLAEDTKPNLAAVIGQQWKWWNFQQGMTMIPRYTAALGELLVEIIDDPIAGNVMLDMVWPGYVADIRLDRVGNVKYYRIEFMYWDRDEEKEHRYVREVDSKSFRTFRDDKPWNYETAPIPVGTDPEGAIHGLGTGGTSRLLPTSRSEGYEWENPYGFAPATWFRHHRVLGVRGEPAVWSTQGQLDEVNGLLSHMINKAHISLAAPLVVAGNLNPNRLQNAFKSMVGAAKRVATADLEDERADAETLNVLEGPQGTTVTTIDLKLAEAGDVLDRITKSIERKCPEIIFYSELRSMTQVTGPSASKLLGDVDRKVRQIASGYDQDLIKTHQMSTAIGGWRLQQGVDGWADPSEAQQKFDGFNLESYAKGDLNFDIMPRDIVPMSTRDRYELLQMKKTVLPFLPPEQLAKEGGYHDETKIKQWVSDFEAKQQEQMQMQMKQQESKIEAKKPVGAPEGGPQRGAPNQNRKTSKD